MEVSKRGRITRRPQASCMLKRPEIQLLTTYSQSSKICAILTREVGTFCAMQVVISGLPETGDYFCFFLVKGLWTPLKRESIALVQK